MVSTDPWPQGCFNFRKSKDLFKGGWGSLIACNLYNSLFSLNTLYQESYAYIFSILSIKNVLVLLKILDVKQDIYPLKTKLKRQVTNSYQCYMLKHFKMYT